MFQNRRILAVVPARSGSKGIADKNLKLLAGHSLIARAGHCLKELAWIDARVLSTDSMRYATEGEAAGLSRFFLRPPEMSQNHSPAMEALEHALVATEKEFETRFDYILWIEPTSPLRRAEDLTACLNLLIEKGCDSVVTVSPVDPKFHPAKVFRSIEGYVEYYENRGKNIVRRQELEPLTYRNGVCYALTRECVLDRKQFITEKTLPYLISRPLANIDEPIDFEWAEFLLKESSK